MSEKEKVKIKNEELVAESNSSVPSFGSEKSKGRPKEEKDPVALLVEQVAKLREELETTKESLETTKESLETTKKKMESQTGVIQRERMDKSKRTAYSPPKYSGATQRVKFMRNDQPNNPMQVRLRKVVSNKEKSAHPVYGLNELIDYDENLIPGNIYELPVPIVEFLNTRSEPTYGERPNPNSPGDTYTTVIGEKQRCYCMPA